MDRKQWRRNEPRASHHNRRTPHAHKANTLVRVGACGFRLVSALCPWMHRQHTPDDVCNVIHATLAPVGRAQRHEKDGAEPAGQRCNCRDSLATIQSE